MGEQISVGNIVSLSPVTDSFNRPFVSVVTTKGNFIVWGPASVVLDSEAFVEERIGSDGVINQWLVVGKKSFRIM